MASGQGGTASELGSRESGRVPLAQGNPAGELWRAVCNTPMHGRAPHLPHPAASAFFTKDRLGLLECRLPMATSFDFSRKKLQPGFSKISRFLWH